MNIPFELLSIITKRPANEQFGTEIATAFALTFGNKASKCDYAAAGIICTLFLSSILEEFPTMQLHTFVRNYREEQAIFSFDCKSYDAIYSNIKNKKMLLVNKEFKYVEREVEKQDILESFDFFTNQ